jgi:hypothetical protein
MGPNYQTIPGQGALPRTGGNVNIILLSDNNTCLGVEDYLVKYIKAYGTITNLEDWARHNGLSGKWVREVARSAEQKGLLKIEQIKNQVGRPCKISLRE